MPRGPCRGSARRINDNDPAMLGAQTDALLDRLRAAINAMRAARSLASDDPKAHEIEPLRR